MKDKIRCDYLIITDGKDMAQKSAHLINDTLRTLTSQPKVLVRNIHDQGKQKDKIKCKKVMILLLARVSFFQLVLNWLNALPGIMNWNKQVLVLIQEQDTETGDRSDIDRVISEINQEKGIDMIKWILSFNDISSWWSLIIKFLFKVKSFPSKDITYKLAFTMHEMRNSKIAGILSNTFSSFKLEENDASELYVVRVTNTTQRGDIIDTHTGINIYYKSDSCALSIAMLAVLIDLKVIKAKQTKQVTRAIRTKTKQSNRALTCLLNILYSFLFVLTSLLNLPFIAIHVPFTCLLSWQSPGIIIPVMFLYYIANGAKRWNVIVIHNILVFIMFCILVGVLSIFYKCGSILIGIYAIVWPILLHTLLCKIGLDFGVVSLPSVAWRKIDFGFLRVIYGHCGSMREQTCVRKIKPILNSLFTLMHIPVIILYCFLFLSVVTLFESKRDFTYFSVFYTNFALVLGFGIAGGLLLFSKFYLAAILTIIISLYIFFILCVLHTY